MIDVQELRYRYPGAQLDTLHDLSFSVEEGEIFGFLGPSGAGKSTTQKLLIKLLRDYVGRARVFGRELSEWGPEFYEEIGVSFELPNHYQRLSARENLEHFASLYQKETLPPEIVLEWVDLSAHANKRVEEFSKGMKIRLNVARSLIHQPKLLFLDEPTSGLDPVNAARIQDLILRLRSEGATVFITTHDMVVADQLCDRVAFLTGGTIHTIDSPFALRKQHGKRTLRVEYSQGEQNGQAEFPLDDLHENADFHHLLRESRIETMHSQETTLAQVFIDVTGKELGS